MLRPRVGQIILTATLFLTVATIVISSIVAAQAHEAERNTVFAEEADGTAMTFVQRESFGVLIALDSWARGTSTAREVQIARAVLGQRLGVITNTGTATFDLAGPDYQASLAVIDGYLLELGDVPDELRESHRSEIQPVVATFSTEVRELSATFQDISRRQIQSVLDDRVVAELWQSGLSAFALSLGLTLFVWLGIDINRGYRRSARELAAQAATLERTRQRLILLQRIDARSRSWLEEVNRSTPRAEVFEMIRSEIAEIVPGLIVEVRYDDQMPVRVVARAESAVDDDDDEALIARAVETVRLIVARDSGEAELAFQRIHDSLTGLPNRVQFEPLVTDSLATPVSAGECVAVLLVDLDRFTDFNGSLGHEAGDDLLLAVAAALRAAAPHPVHLARLSSDEFGAVGRFSSREIALATMHAIVDAVDFEWEHAGVRTRISAGAGVAIAAEGVDAGTLIQQAAAAIQLAKSRGERGAWVEYDGALHDGLLTTMHEESALRAAMRAGEFVVHFQPVVELSTGALAGAEALVRWERPGVGLVPPNDFLPAISHAGMAAELGREVIDQSLRSWGRLLRSDLAVGSDDAPYVSINVDPAQLDQPHLADFVLTAASRHGVPCSSVVIEVTERSVAGSVLAIDQLNELRSHGVRIALDDFGTGYSSLAQASVLPLDILKIDQSFVPRDGLAEQSRRLIGDICGIGATLGLIVTAEGVETDSVAASLRELGVRFGQGFLYSRAIPESELAAWIVARSARPVRGARLRQPARLA